MSAGSRNLAGEVFLNLSNSLTRHGREVTMKKSLKAGIVLIALHAGVAAMANPAPPKLILQITVDQLRGDLPARYLAQMRDGGFRYLLEEGVVFKDARHGHANTETVVGHTTLATGADPAEHGMVANVWFDRETEMLAYNIEDPRYAILTAGADVDEATEVDLTQKIASTDGRSPANILVTTFSDELALHSNGKAKIFGVSVKDRGAVTLAGHVGKAFWYSKSVNRFITSSYYYDSYPSWVDAWNDQDVPRNYSETSWVLLNEASTYVHATEDNQPWEMDFGGFGRIFPHEYGPADDDYFGNFLTFSPAGDELTLDFAMALIEAKKLGADDVTDFLAVSFSSTDYVGHIFGPSSLEAEDNLLRLDRTLAKLFDYIDQQIGLENTLIVLSADHGGPEAPGYWQSFGIDAGFVTPDQWEQAPSIAALKKKFGIGQELIKSFFPPYLYLDREVIRDKGLDQGEVEQAVADELMSLKGVALAVSATALLENRLPDTYLNRAALRNFNAKRSGDILILFQPHYSINGFEGETVAANHGGPWRYDTFVPIIFVGHGLKPVDVYRPVETVDVARTLAAYIGTKPPSGVSGKVLEEIVGQRGY